VRIDLDAQHTAMLGGNVPKALGFDMRTPLAREE